MRVSRFNGSSNRAWSYFIIPFFEDYATYFSGSCGDTFCSFPPHKIFKFLPANSLSRKIFRSAIAQFIHELKRRPRLSNLLGVSLVSSEYETTLSGSSSSYDIASPVFNHLAKSSKFIVLSGPLFRAKHKNWCAKHGDLIRNYFEPIKAIRTKVDTLLKECRKEAPILVGVHTRRGDYATILEGRYYFSHAHYARLIHEIKRLLASWHENETVHFILSSDEFIPVSPFSGLNVSILNGSAVHDLYTLAGCDYLIGPPSTFGYWASWHGRVLRYTIKDPEYAPKQSDFLSVSDWNLDRHIDLCWVWYTD